jgi:APA family basic amino acid/polyamine antiporter
MLSPSKETKPALRLFDLTMIVISLVIGMGIFRTPATVALKSGSLFIFYAAWIAGGIITYCGARTFAEIGRRLPVTGAYYRIFSEAYSPAVAFAINAVTLISNSVTIGGVALIGADYIHGVLPGIPVNAIAAGCIIVFYIVNLLGLRTSATTQNIMIGIKLIAIAVIILCLVMLPSAPVPSAVAVITEKVTHSPLAALGIALIAVSFTYGGYQQSINFGGDSDAQGRQVPKAIMLGTFLVMGIYILTNIAYVHVIGFEALKTTDNIAAVVATNLMGPLGGKILAAILFVSVCGAINVNFMTNPRVMTAMCEDGVLPKWFTHTDRSRHVDPRALSIFAAGSFASVFFGKSFEHLLTFTIFLDCIGMIFAAGSLFVLAKRLPVTLQLKALTAVFIAGYAFIGFSVYNDDPKAAIVGTILTTVVSLLGWLMLRSRSGGARRPEEVS